MTKASDNKYPKLLLDFNSASPSAPGDASWKMYAKANGIFARSSNTEVGPFATAGGSGTSLNPGTSFPVGPSTNDLCFRTDRGRLYYYDGTRWLTVQEFSQTIGLLDTLAPITTTATINYGPIDHADNGCYATRLVMVTISVSNDGSNYHTVQLTTRPASGAGSNLGSSFTTAADTASNRVIHTVTIGSVVTSTHKDYAISCTRTGSNASIYPEATLYYRLVG